MKKAAESGSSRQQQTAAGSGMQRQAAADSGRQRQTAASSCNFLTRKISARATVLLHCLSTLPIGRQVKSAMPSSYSSDSSSDSTDSETSSVEAARQAEKRKRICCKLKPQSALKKRRIPRKVPYDNSHYASERGLTTAEFENMLAMGIPK